MRKVISNKKVVIFQKMSHNEIEDYEERKTFLDNLKILNKIEQEEVFRILKKNASSFSENSNGIFFDVSSINMQTFKELLEFLHFCKKNREAFDNREQEQLKASEALNQNN